MNLVFVVGNDREQCLYRVAGKGIRVQAVVAADVHRERLGSWREACERLGVDYVQIARDDVYETVAGLKPDLLVSIGFPYMLPQAVLDIPRLALNVHPTLLPKYRGARSGYHILANNEPKSGVTIHRMTAEMDRGDIVRQAEFPLSLFDTPASMMRKSRRAEADLLADVISDLLEGRPLGFTPQNEAEATEFSQLRTPEDSKMDPRRSLLELFPHIRACDPDKYPAFFDFEGERIYVRLCRASKPSDEMDLI